MTTTQSATIETVCNTVKSYYPEADTLLIQKAYEFADNHHKGQLRSSGDPYIIHPTEVAQTLATMKLDTASIISALLHDTVEDTSATLEEVEKIFGPDVAQLVDGVTKLSKIHFRTTEEKQAENFRKMIIAMAKDIRVIIIKLADRLNNMQTLEHLPAHKQKSIATETLEIYAPIANRLGISWMKTELEDLCLRFIHPDIYYKLAQKVSKTKKEREKYIEEVCQIFREKLHDYDVKGEVSGRAKHFFSVFKKMERRNAEFDQINDIIAFRILVENITECYKTLGVIHATYKPVPGRFKDYIAMPKANGYQSLHTMVIGPYGERVEIQIRTHEMHLIAERGIAAHWSYKEGHVSSKSKNSVEWVNRLLEWQRDLSDPNEFLETVKIDLFEEDIFVFTPKGSVKQLSSGSTPLDFAYSVHTDVGNHCVGAKVSGKIVPLKHKLKSGDTIEIITSPTQTPSKDWLKIVRSSKAKAKIRNYIKQNEREKAKLLGIEILDKEFKKFDLNLNKVEKTNKFDKVLEKLGFKTLDEMYVAVGYGRTFAIDIVKHILSKEQFEVAFQKINEDLPTEENQSFLKKVFRSARKKSEVKNAIKVDNIDGILIRFGKCCNPLPGDSIVGFITRGRGVTVHTANCPKGLDTDKNRKVDVSWNITNNAKVTRTVKIKVLSGDEPGLLGIMSQAIAAHNVNIASASARASRDKRAISQFEVEVSTVDQLEKIIRSIEALKGVIAVERSRS